MDKIEAVLDEIRDELEYIRKGMDQLEVIAEKFVEFVKIFDTWATRDIQR